MRIAIAGFQHETNTFVAEPTGWPAFVQADSWPGLLRGAAVFHETAGMNLPIAGFAQAALATGADLAPILWCAAEPGGVVTDDAFGRVRDLILDALAGAEDVDAVYLDLHGAMVTQTHDDGEGALLRAVRAAIGPQTSLVASLDLHANVTEAMVTASDALTVYRTYPHIDMAETGARAFRMLERMVAHGRPAKAWRQAAFLVPLHAQHTDADPSRALYKRLEAFDPRRGALVEMALGFTASDIPDAGPSVLAYADAQSQADHLADALLGALGAAEIQFETGLLSPNEAVARARANGGGAPVVIADVQDNPGAGASSDTTGLLRELLRQEARGTLLGLFHDPDLAQQAHRQGPGAQFEAQIGGRSPGDTPLAARVRVCHLSDTPCAYTGQMYGGGLCTMGPAAALELGESGIVVVVTSIRTQCLDLAQFRHFNLEPSTAPILCVKSTAHFRADFAPLASEILLTAAPGQFPCDLTKVRFTKLRPGVRQTPRKPPGAT